MVTLLDRQSRIDLGINTFPRSIVWSALLLLKNNKTLGDPTTNPYFNSVRIGINPASSVIVIESTLPYDRTSFVNSNGDFIDSILSVGVSDPSIDVASLDPADPVFIELPDPDDSRLNSLEKFFVYCCMYYKVGLSRYANDINSIGVVFLDEQLINNFPTVRVTVSLPFSYSKYFCSNNLVESVFELFTDDSCADGLLAINGGFVLVFADDVLINLGIVP